MAPLEEATYLTSHQGISKGYRPKGLNPKDDTPIWASKDEWIMQGKAVRAYGDRAMDMLNNVMIDPGVIRALASSQGRSGAVRRSASVGFQTGGPTSTATPLAAPPVINVPEQPPSIVATEGTMEELLRGGRNSAIEFLREVGALPTDQGRLT